MNRAGPTRKRALPIDEKALRHPAEKPIFLASVLLNVALLALALYVATDAPKWLQERELIVKHLNQIRALATGMALAPFALTFVRNARRSYLRGCSVVLSRNQFPEIYRILESQCAMIGLEPTPVLMLSEKGISDVSSAFRANRENFIVLKTTLVEPAFARVREILSFTLAREIGRIRLGHTKWFHELLVAYVVRIPILRDPLEKVSVLSLDRYAARLAPDGLPGLISLASGRLLVHNVNMTDYIKQLDEYRNHRIWRWIAGIGKHDVPPMQRVICLYNAGLLNREDDLRRFAAQTPAKGWEAAVAIPSIIDPTPRAAAAPA
jgi:hypothetical protein